MVNLRIKFPIKTKSVSCNLKNHNILYKNKRYFVVKEEHKK